jgi:glycosyltransferase involved in cell wall biosynthesis
VKIALVVPGGFDPEGREVIPALVELAGALAGRHEVHVFPLDGTASPSGHHVMAGAAVHPVGPRGLRPAGPWGWRLGAAAVEWGRLAWRLARALDGAAAAAPFDLVHGFWASDAGLLAGLAGRRLGRPVVVSVGGGEAVWIADIGYGGAGSRLGRARLRLAFGTADAVTVGSEHARTFLPAAAAARAQVIPLGVAAARFAAGVERAPGPPWRLLHVASLNRVKDQETLLLAFAEVCARHHDVHLDCVGLDTTGGAVERRARALGLGDRVRFHGFLPQGELVPLYRAAHLHVLSSRYESQAVVVLEAAAAGVPTAGTAVGLVPALAALSPAAAAPVPPGAPARLAGAISALLGDEVARRVMGEAAARFAVAHDVAWTARSFEDLYRRCLTPLRAP